MNRIPRIVTAAVLLAVVASCSEEDPRLARFAEESVRQQAGQNREMSQLNREVAQAHQDLVELQQNVEKRQAEVDHQRDQLEAERRDIAGQRFRDPILAAAISNVGMVAACLVPLALAAYLLYCLGNRSDDGAVGELLIEELARDRPLLLPVPETSLAHIEDHRNPESPSLLETDTQGPEDSPT